MAWGSIVFDMNYLSSFGLTSGDFGRIPKKYFSKDGVELAGVEEAGVIRNHQSLFNKVNEITNGEYAAQKHVTPVGTTQGSKETQKTNPHTPLLSFNGQSKVSNPFAMPTPNQNGNGLYAIEYIA